MCAEWKKWKRNTNFLSLQFYICLISIHALYISVHHFLTCFNKNLDRKSFSIIPYLVITGKAQTARRLRGLFAGLHRVLCYTPTHRTWAVFGGANFSSQGFHTKACCVVRAALLNADWQIAVIFVALANGRWSTQHAQRSKPQCEKAFTHQCALTVRKRKRFLVCTHKFLASGIFCTNHSARPKAERRLSVTLPSDAVW